MNDFRLGSLKRSLSAALWLVVAGLGSFGMETAGERSLWNFLAARTARGADGVPIVGELRVQPPAIRLIHPRQPHSILVTAIGADGRQLDLTGQAAFASEDAKIATVSSLGWVQPVANGETRIAISAGGKTATVAVTVGLPEALPPHSFRHDVMPALSKAGCNMGACHGYSLGKNGFKLSLRGADAAADFLSISDEFLERRVNRHQPAASLLLTKPLGEVPHKGGVRFDTGSLLHQLMLGWIADGG
jgi:hypothetical protein